MARKSGKTDSEFSLLMERKEATDFVLGNEAINTFDKIALEQDFPKVRGLDTKVRYPRDAIAQWLSDPVNLAKLA